MKNTTLVPVQTAPKLYSTIFIPTFLCTCTHAPPKKGRRVGGGKRVRECGATQKMENHWRWSWGDRDRDRDTRFFDWLPCRNGARVRSGLVVQAPEPQLSGTTAEHQQSATKLICARSASLRRLRRGHGRPYNCVEMARLQSAGRLSRKANPRPALRLLSCQGKVWGAQGGDGESESCGTVVSPIQLGLPRSQWSHLVNFSGRVVAVRLPQLLWLFYCSARPLAPHFGRAPEKELPK